MLAALSFLNKRARAAAKDTHYPSFESGALNLTSYLFVHLNFKILNLNLLKDSLDIKKSPRSEVVTRNHET